MDGFINPAVRSLFSPIYLEFAVSAGIPMGSPDPALALNLDMALESG